jgi:DNA primase
VTRDTKYQYAEFAERHMEVVLKSGSEWMVRCPFHDNTGSASGQLNVEKGLFVCFSCGEGATVKKIATHLGIAIDEAEKAPDVTDLLRKLHDLRVSTKALAEPDPLPESTLKRYTFPTDYWTGRGFNLQTIDAFDLGFEPLNNFATIPIRNDRAQLLGVIKRYLDDDADLKYRYPKGFSRSKNLFASWMVEHTDSDLVVITEGAVDCMKVWQAGYPAVAQYGSSIGAEQVRLLRRLGVGQIVLFYDNDTAGRKAAQVAQGLKVHKRGRFQRKEYVPELDLRRGFLLREVRYTSKMKSDPGAMNEAQITKAIDSAVRLT